MKEKEFVWIWKTLWESERENKENAKNKQQRKVLGEIGGIGGVTKSDEGKTATKKQEPVSELKNKVLYLSLPWACGLWCNSIFFWDVYIEVARLKANSVTNFASYYYFNFTVIMFFLSFLGFFSFILITCLFWLVGIVLYNVYSIQL